MTKSQNTKNEQQKDLCITSEQLTEQWKKGELPSGWYWVDGSRAQGIYAYTAEYLNTMYRPKNSERIIEQMPSYEEWQRIYHYASKYEVEYTSCVMDYENLKEENTKLKELLKGAKEIIKLYLKWYKEDCGCKDVETEEMNAKINQALGEDK